MTLLAVIATATILGCQSKTVRPEYSMQLPTLTRAPLWTRCVTESGVESCVMIARDDYEMLVRELKGCCIALGHSVKKCGGK